MEEKFIRLKTEVTIVDRAGVVDTGIVIGRTYVKPFKYDVATKEKIHLNLTWQDLVAEPQKLLTHHV